MSNNDITRKEERLRIADQPEKIDSPDLLPEFIKVLREVEPFIEEERMTPEEARELGYRYVRVTQCGCGIGASSSYWIYPDGTYDLDLPVKI